MAAVLDEPARPARPARPVGTARPCTAGRPPGRARAWSCRPRRARRTGRPAVPDPGSWRRPRRARPPVPGSGHRPWRRSGGFGRCRLAGRAALRRGRRLDVVGDRPSAVRLGSAGAALAPWRPPACVPLAAWRRPCGAVLDRHRPPPRPASPPSATVGLAGRRPGLAARPRLGRGLLAGRRCGRLAGRPRLGDGRRRPTLVRRALVDGIRRSPRRSTGAVPVGRLGYRLRRDLRTEQRLELGRDVAPRLVRVARRRGRSLVPPDRSCDPRAAAGSSASGR